MSHGLIALFVLVCVLLVFGPWAALVVSVILLLALAVAR